MHEENDGKRNVKSGEVGAERKAWNDELCSSHARKTEDEGKPKSKNKQKIEEEKIEKSKNKTNRKD